MASESFIKVYTKDGKEFMVSTDALLSLPTKLKKEEKSCLSPMSKEFHPSEDVKQLVATPVKEQSPEEDGKSEKKSEPEPEHEPPAQVANGGAGGAVEPEEVEEKPSYASALRKSSDVDTMDTPQHMMRRIMKTLDKEISKTDDGHSVTFWHLFVGVLLETAMARPAYTGDKRRYLNELKNQRRCRVAGFYGEIMKYLNTAKDIHFTTAYPHTKIIGQIIDTFDNDQDRIARVITDTIYKLSRYAKQQCDRDHGDNEEDEVQCNFAHTNDRDIFYTHTVRAIVMNITTNRFTKSVFERYGFYRADDSKCLVEHITVFLQLITTMVGNPRKHSKITLDYKGVTPKMFNMASSKMDGTRQFLYRPQRKRVYVEEEAELSPPSNEEDNCDDDE